MALAGTDACIYITAHPSLSATNETCTDSGDHINYTASVHTVWDKEQTLTIQCSPNGSGSWETVTDYVFHYATGQIVFNTARVVDTNDRVRISTGKYFNLTEAANASQWSISLKGESKDTTPFKATGAMRQRTGTLKDWSAKFNTFNYDDTFFDELTKIVVIAFYVDYSAGTYWIGTGTLSGLDIATAEDDVATQNVSVEAADEIVYVAA